jgi:alkylated DNA repair dioxygenase AlkB
MFDNDYSQSENLLPLDGEVFYFGKVFSSDMSSHLQEQLLSEIDWQQDEVKVFGKTFITSRKTAWYADEGLSYTYSGITRNALSWTPALLMVKQQVEALCGISFNACLLNLYHHGEEGMGWHSDDEPELGKLPEIASVSLGAERRFDFKHKSRDLKVSVMLEDGSLLWMRGLSQARWKHALPKTKKVKSRRINITFRRILTEKK